MERLVDFIRDNEEEDSDGEVRYGREGERRVRGKTGVVSGLHHRQGGREFR